MIKQFVFGLAILALLGLSFGCGEDGGPTIDASSHESMETSFQELAEYAEAEGKLEEFGEAIWAVQMGAVFDSVMDGRSAEDVQQELWEALDGMNLEEFIAFVGEHAEEPARQEQQGYGSIAPESYAP